MKRSKNDRQQDSDANINKIEHIVAGMHASKLPDIDSEWDELEKRIEKSEETRVTPVFTKIRIVAASVACAVLLFTGVAGYFNFKKIYYTTSNNKLTITLKDSSVIYMNRNSSIRYNAGYGLVHRKINLSGEASFKVKKGSNPFIVYTSAGNIKVTGTQFNVKARNGRTEVGVLEGRVEFSSVINKKSKVILTKGLFSSCKENDVPTMAIVKEQSEFSGWLNDRFVYRATTVKNIITDFEEQYNIKIEGNNSKILDLEVTGVIEGDSPDEVLQTLCMLIGKKYRLNKDIYEIY
jgi:ferric-dicitrate binding protein FerR (iron transport regulator)